MYFNFLSRIVLTFSVLHWIFIHPLCLSLECWNKSGEVVLLESIIELEFWVLWGIWPYLSYGAWF